MLPTNNNSNQLQETTQPHTTQTTVQDTDVLEVIGDQYSIAVITTLARADNPIPVADIIATADISKATAYRRLEKLEQANIVTRTITHDEISGNKRVYELCTQSITIEFCPTGLSVTGTE